MRRSRPRAVRRGVLLLCLAAASPAPAADEPAPFTLLSQPVAAGEARRLSLALTESFSGAAVHTPVDVVHGARPGPVLCLIAGIHGDELNGIEIVRRVVADLDAAALAGTLVAVPIANPLAFRTGERYLPDRRDLNRSFPGRDTGSLAQRVARRLFDGVVRACTHLVDLHSGSGRRRNLPQLRGDADDPRVRALLAASGLTALHGKRGRDGTLRRAAGEVGIPALLFEGGEAHRFDRDDIAAGLHAIAAVMRALDMLPAVQDAGRTPAPLFARSTWVRADGGGILLRHVELGADVLAGSVLGEIVDPLGGERIEVVAPVDGRVIGRAANQLVLPGFGLFHLATEPLARP